jgi:hypothetical protein
MFLFVGSSQKHAPDPLPPPSAAEHLESVRPLPVEIDTRSPVRFEVYSEQGNKAVKGVVLQVRAFVWRWHHQRLFFFSSVRHAAHQVVPGGDDAGEGYRLRFDRDINVKLPSNV